jgi:hypothetical protein
MPKTSNPARAASVILIALVIAAATPAEAEPIQYFFSGVGSGTVGDRSFTNAPFTITATADTAAVQDLVGQGGNLLHSVATQSRIDVEGIGGGAINLQTRVFSTDEPTPAVGFSRLPHFDGLDLMDLIEPAFAGYRARTAFGPVTDFEPVAIDQFRNIPSALGPITFAGVQFVTFRAVPEPGAVAAAPAAGLLLRRRRRVLSRC